MKKRILSLLLCLCLLLALGITASAEGLQHIGDTAGILTEEEQYELEGILEQGDPYGCGIYIVILGDYQSEIGGSDPMEAAEYIYTQLGFGFGEESDGIMLMMSMADRKYAFISKGHFGNHVKSDPFYDRVLDGMLDYFGEDDWMGGFTYYAQSCLEGVETVGAWRSENPEADWDEYKEALPGIYRFGGVAICFLLALLIAWGIVAVLKNQLKSVYTGTQADNYIEGGLQLSARYDNFTHTTETRTYSPESKDDDDSHSSSGGGFSGGSGDF